MVAPRAGAWIETMCFCPTSPCARSRPVRARGLKPGGCGQALAGRQSRPVRARGLKLCPDGVGCDLIRSRPVRARGLKHFEAGLVQCDLVAPRAGAWIETPAGLAPQS